MDRMATVYDVAELAGVSRGTVDRVVYGRGRVSEKTEKKVREAIEKLNYKANPIASCLAMKKVRRIAYLTPSYRPGEYWDFIDRGFEAGKQILSRYNMELLPFHYDINSVDSYAREAKKLLACNPDGVITHEAPREALLQLVDELKERNIPLAFVDNKYDDIDYMMYYGVDAYKSGALGAFLLTARQEIRDVAVVRIRRNSDQIRDPNATRRHGVMDYLTEHFPECSISTIMIDGNPYSDNGAIMDSFFFGHPEVKHIICPNSRLYLIADWLRVNPDPERIVVGYDDLDRNLQALKDGVADFLVTRKVPEQSRLLLEDFSYCILHGVLPQKKNNYVHMDILHKMNLDDYR